jgi:hypothetical protein
MVTPNTILCQILAVQPLPTAGTTRWAVTLGDGKGEVVTVELDEASLQTYERFQIAVHHATGHTFRYLPFGAGEAEADDVPFELTRLATRDDPV